MASAPTAASIIVHLGGEEFLARLGARHFVTDENHLSFILIHDTPRNVHSVSISIEANGNFKVTCYGRIVPGSLHAPILGTATADILENLAPVFARLTGIEVLRDRHL